jgi:hypothetical protein
VHDVFDHVFQHCVAREYWVHLGTAVFRLEEGRESSENPLVKRNPRLRASINGLLLIP